MANKVIIMGNLTRDPELRALSSGTSVAELAIALNRKFTSNGEKKEETTFVDVVFWGKQAEIVAQYAKKGRQLYIEGRLTQDSWEDGEGNKRTKIKITGEDFEFVGSAQQDGQATSQKASQPKQSQPAVVEINEEIPF